MRTAHRTALGALVACVALWCAADAAHAVNPRIREMVRERVPGAGRVAAPVQPASGPGGKSYRHGKVTETKFGAEADECWIFEPGDPAPKKAPVIIFLHGWGAMQPQPYRGWIDHLVKRGNIVIYPRFQLLRTRPAEFTPNAVKAVKAALDLLKKPPHVAPDETKLAIAGHSAGGVGAVNLAAVAAREGLPAPRAVVIVQPGRSPNPRDADPRRGIPLEDLSTVPAKALALVLVGNEDRVAGDAVAKDIFARLRHIPKANRDYVTVQSDGHGMPQLKADHLSPCAGPERGADALDWYGYWKLLDGLTDAAFYNRNRHFALGGAPPMRNMGTWSDGRMVRQLIVTDAPR